MHLIEAMACVQAYGPLDESRVRALVSDAGLVLYRQQPQLDEQVRLGFSSMIDNGVRYLMMLFDPRASLDEFDQCCRQVAETYVVVGAPPAELLAAIRSILCMTLSAHLAAGDEQVRFSEALYQLLEHAHGIMFPEMNPPA